MKKFDIEALLEMGILREDPFREKIKNMRWEEYRGDQVLIKGCSSVPIPTWAYLIVAAQLAQVAQEVYYGEEKAPNLIFKGDAHGVKI